MIDVFFLHGFFSSQKGMIVLAAGKHKIVSYKWKPYGE